jgi:hypothetical protein
LAYQIVAVKENETVRCERISVLIAIAPRIINPPKDAPIWCLGRAILTELMKRRAQAHGVDAARMGAITKTSTTLADLFTPLLFADLPSAVRTSLRSWSNDEFDDSVAYSRQARLRRWTVDSFFSAPLVRDGDAGGMRRRSWS